MAFTPPPYTGSSHIQAQQQIAQQQTIPLPITPLPPMSSMLMPPVNPSNTPQVSTSKWHFKQLVPVILALATIVGIYFIWSTAAGPAAPSTNVGSTQQSFGRGSSATSTKSGISNTSSSSGTIQVYIVGAVKHPGVYTLAAGARVFELLQAAGGPLPKANLVALNLAAKLTDGEEVYVTLVGETPPTYMGGVPGPGTGTNSSTITTGQLVNINTASEDEMRQSLHISSTTAEAIVNYRLQHGDYTSLDELLQVVSKAIYDKIKSQVTVS